MPHVIVIGNTPLSVFLNFTAQRMTGNSQDGSFSNMPIQEPQPQPVKKRKQALSPEIREFLHMLKSLETERDPSRGSAS